MSVKEIELDFSFFRVITDNCKNTYKTNVTTKKKTPELSVCRSCLTLSHESDLNITNRRIRVSRGGLLLH